MISAARNAGDEHKAWGVSPRKRIGKMAKPAKRAAASNKWANRTQI